MTANNTKPEQRDSPTPNAGHQDSLELAAAGPDQKNWRGIGIALLVIVCVCALIVAAIILLTPGDKGFILNKTRLSLDEVIKGRFSYRRYNGTWISDHEFIFQDTYGAIGIYDVKNNSEQVLMSNSTIRQYSINQFSLSADRLYLLLAHKYEKIFRYTYKAAFLLYDINKELLVPLFPDTPDLLLQHAEWGPSGNQLVYILDNNVYYKSDASAKAKKLTSSGVDGVIFNGIPDWVYEEEILSTNNALYWSKDGKKLSFVTFNDTEVEILQYPHYGSYKDISNVYPEFKNIRYPKAGRTNPTFTIWVADLTVNMELSKISPPVEYKDIEHYFTEIQFVDTNTLSIIWLKRSQNSTILSLCRKENNWNCIKSLQEEANGHGWVDLSTKTIFSADASKYFLRLPGPSEGNSGRFRQIAEVDAKNGSKTFLTSGKQDVVSIITHDLKRKIVYYITTLEGKPGERHVFSVTDMSHTTPKKTVCYTCNLAPDCLYNDATFSVNNTFYVLDCLGPEIPRVEIRYGDSNELVMVLDTNSDLKELVDQRAMPKVKYIEVPITEHFNARVRLLLPPGLREYEITKYPMLVEVYGGPGSQMITEKFSVNWGTYLASSKNIIYASIDGRGSGNQGDKVLHEVYRQLGTYEIYDQISAASYLKDHLPYIDSKHIAIFGWSYGGFASALALTNDETVFNCGISVAPVTSWLYYDSVYTERYMQSPASNDNLANYKSSDVMKRAPKFKGKKYMLVHGTADDNVHWQQSMMLAKSLTDAGIIYRMQVYPDENHALGSVKIHLYHTLGDFLDHCYSETFKDSDGHKAADSDN